ncbi:3D domain-containing protein [Alkalibacillus sp. S2W]|uniref:3D domain-containing protein n=1 Tax=Alkalibacillus sp. S2W TaxID=3386553 RepID=UPI00398CE291
MNKTIVLMLGAGILIAILLVAFDSNIKDANSSQDTDAENTEDTDSSKTSSNNYQAISTHLSTKESITVVKSESKTKVANKQSSNQADNEEKESKQNNEQQQSQESNQNNNQEQETKQQDNSGEVQHVSESNDVKETMYMEATAYTAHCDGCSGTTKTGIDLRANPNQKVIAVDPNVIPLGATVWVEGYGTAVAGDIGGAIKGNRIDVFMANEADANRFGRRQVQIKILDY